MTCNKQHKKHYTNDELDNVIKSLLKSHVEKMNAFIVEVKEQEACIDNVCQVMFKFFVLLANETIDFFHEREPTITKETHLVALMKIVADMNNLNFHWIEDTNDKSLH